MIATVSLGSLLRIAKGKKPLDVSAEAKPGYVQHLQIADLRRERRPEYVPATGATIARAEDILICWDGSKAGTSATGLAGAAGSTIAVLRLSDTRFTTRYVAWFLKANFGRLNSSAVGAAVPHVDKRVLEELRLPLVSPDKQLRIADILDKADAIRRKRKEAIALTEELLRSAFLEMFGDPVTNPKGWRRSTFGQEVELLEYGPRFYNERYSDNGVRIVRITDLEPSGRLDFSAMPRLVVAESDKAKYLLRPGDVIFARSGATVGKTALSMPGDPEAIPGAYFIRLRFKPTVRPLFARQVLASERVQQIIISRSRQSAQQNFSGPGIRELPLPVPPIDLQDRLEKIACSQKTLLCDYRAVAADSEKLFGSLLQRAFVGDLGGAARSC